MFPSVLQIVAAQIVRLTPNTPPALWIPYAAYAGIALAATGIALGTWRMTGSRLATAAAVAGYVATPMTSDGGGMLMIALMFLGLFDTPRRPLGGWLFVLIIPGILISQFSALLAWCLVGCGLRYVSTSVATKRWPRFTGIGLVALLLMIIVTAPLPAVGRSEPPSPKPMGHDRITLNKMRALLANIPSGSDIVRDDAITGILLRAIQRDFERARIDIEPIDLDPAAIRPELNMQRRVFALPHAQQSLAMRGFKIVDSLRVADRGLAEVTAGGACVAASQTWQTAISLTGLRDLAFVSDRESRRGPVVIYLVGIEPIHVNAVNWSARTLRGFSPRTFDLSKDQERQDFERQRLEDGGPRTMDLTGRTSVTRVALWRMPDAALAMPINLSAPASYAAVKLAPEADRPVSVCPSFPATVSVIR